MKSFADVHAKVSIELNDGRNIILDELIQSRTYSGLLMGAPREAGNEFIIESAIKRAQKQFGDPPPFLIEPLFVDYEVEIVRQRLDRSLKVNPDDGEIQRVRGKRLPLTLCMASFTCTEPLDRGSVGRIFDQSNANMVWFQEEFGPPWGSDVLRQIKSVPWNEIACDVSQ